MKAYYTQQRVYYMLGGRVNLEFCFYISFHHVGQDAVSKSQHAINTKRYGQPHFDVFPCRINVEYVNQTIGVNWAEVVFFKILST